MTNAVNANPAHSTGPRTFVWLWLDSVERVSSNKIR